jgi:Fic family protein
MGRSGHHKALTWTPAFKSAGRSHSQAQRYKAFIPDKIGHEEPELKSVTATLSERAGTAVRELNADHAGLVSLEGLGRQLLRSEALASSQIEGLNISHRKLAEADLEGRQGPYKAKEILGTIRAMERAMSIGAEASDLTTEMIAEIHKEIAIEPPLDKIAGQFRKEPGWIGGSSPPNAEYVGPPWEQVMPLLEDLCTFMNRDDIAPIPQAAIAHAQFELIHPFGDGNGRVGRCLVHVLLGRRDVAPRYVPPVSLVLGANKDAYIAGLQSFRVGETDQWVAQFSHAVEIAAEKAREFSERIAEHQEKWKDKVEPVRKDAAVLPLIEILPKYPIIKAGVAEKEIERSRPATINALNQLEEAGVLKRRRNQRQGDSWEAKELFALLDEFEEAVRMPTQTA